MISDIAFESDYPYSLHPTAVNSSINVWDVYRYQSGVRLLDTGGGCYSNNGPRCGPLCFNAENALTFTYDDVGSSWYPKYPKATVTNSSINVGDIYYYQSGVRVLRAGNCYNNGAQCGPLSYALNEPLTIAFPDTGSSGYFYLLKYRQQIML